ncbi:hypothetical protein [Flaviaesturariibacter amylovorans]|uniref:MoxR-vWA-beta-propeller ternary system domain-containing protein n=1 Tax=Flaviaesturariibacter amylovorans TaxID=1084520 RepID=A0ABP8HKH4_9BACT
MAVDPANGVGYYLCIAGEHRDLLGGLRGAAHLKVGTEEGLIWVRDLSVAEIESVAVKSIPYKKLYTAADGLLFPLGSRLPDRRLPSLLWTPIDRALPVTLPRGNHNYFGVPDTVDIRLVPTHTEQAPQALLAPLPSLAAYMEGAPAVRLAPLRWLLVSERAALITGTPLLPLPGVAFWRRGNLLLPAGSDLEFPVLAPALQARLDPSGGHWILFPPEGGYWLADKTLFKPLSIGSFRNTQNAAHAGGR